MCCEIEKLGLTSILVASFSRLLKEIQNVPSPSVKPVIQKANSMVFIIRQELACCPPRKMWGNLTFRISRYGFHDARSGLPRYWHIPLWRDLAFTDMSQFTDPALLQDSGKSDRFTRQGTSLKILKQYYSLLSRI